MPRTAGPLAADRIRIEDEVWDEAFSARLRSRPHRSPPASRPERVLRAAPPLAPASSSRPVTPSRRDEVRPFRAPEGSSVVPSEARVTLSLDPEPPVRRTVRIEGRGAERHLRYTPPAHERIGFSPDRLAMWAVLLGFLLVVVATLSSHL